MSLPVSINLNKYYENVNRDNFTTKKMLFSLSIIYERSSAANSLKRERCGWIFTIESRIFNIAVLGESIVRDFISPDSQHIHIHARI